MRFQVLGPLTASVPLPSAAQPRRLLAVLLARAGRFVGRDTLVDELWPDGAPSSAAAIVQVTVSKLRKTLSPGLGAAEAGHSDIVSARWWSSRETTTARGIPT
ncbi:AfsR/SARP family transcriptional regulator, partial [Amycolatopsis mediterranei]|uniref:AfsR/SARP family transcriptional regulator n=1 Tax=Amycolatopsis mediterranei TaxID=33910 RepID=UPI00331FE058